MPKQKSSIKEMVINVVILAVAGGILAWRYNDCKQQEQAAAQRIEEAREEAETAAKQRKKRCLESVDEADRDDCMECTCTSCINEFEACQNDPKCRSMTVESMLGDGAPPATDPARIRFENRAACMLEKCADPCTGKK